MGVYGMFLGSGHLISVHILFAETQDPHLIIRKSRKCGPCAQEKAE